MDHSRIMEYKVGIFVVIATVITLVFILVLGGNRAIFHKSAILHLRTEDTNGLAVGANVQLAGVSCGNVKSIDFDPKSNEIDIALKIDNASLARITEGSVAGIHTQGALGDKYVAIKPGTYSGAPLKHGDIIPAEPNSDFMSAIGKSGNRVEHAFEIIDEVKTLVKGLNDKNFSQNLGDSAKNAKSATEALNQILQPVRTETPRNNKLKILIDHLANIFEKIDNGQGTLGGLINDPTVHEDIKDILGGAKRSKLLKYLIRQAILKNDEEEKKEKKDQGK